MKLEFPRQVVEKVPVVKFHENPSIGNLVGTCSQADRHDEAYSRFSHVCERFEEQVRKCNSSVHLWLIHSLLFNYL